ncbi:MAG TPA: class I SAM-dependent methyltransferase [Symbiobacteriaceae bacterium]|nr:class I SAM-dependent methyltransferase [Symbiobacteriaceae bacterium]
MNSWGEYYHAIASQMALFRESNRSLVEAARLSPGMTVIDLGCGSGLTALAALDAVPEGLKLILVDASPSMIETARRNLGDRVAEYHVADAGQIASLVTERVDRVLCNLAVWYFRDPEAVLREVRKVLKLTGHVAFSLSGTYFNTGGDAVSPQWALMRVLADRGLIPRALPDVDRLPNQRSIEGTLQGAGLKPFFYKAVDIPTERSETEPGGELHEWVRLYPVLEGKTRAEAADRSLAVLPAAAEAIAAHAPKWRTVIFMAQPQITAEEAILTRFAGRGPAR